MSNLTEIVSEGKQLAHVLYEARNEVISSGGDVGGLNLAEELLAAHDEIVRRFVALEHYVYPVGETAKDISEEWSEDLETEWSEDPATKLQETMDRLGMTKTALSKASGVAMGTIQNLLVGNTTPRRSTLSKLEQALGLKEGTLDE